MYTNFQNPHYGLTSFSCLSEREVKFIEDNNLPFDASFVREKMTSMKPFDCRRHGIIQEFIQDVCGGKIDETTSKINKANGHGKHFPKPVQKRK